MKVGRNEPCPCGSGKKWKKCCLQKTRPSKEEILEVFRRKQEREDAKKARLRAMGIYINYVNPVIFKGKRVWALGSRVYVNRNPNETFHEFVIWLLQDTLGKSWFDEESKKPENEQHFVYRCFIEYGNWSRKMGTPENKVGELWAAPPSGWVQALAALAYDTASLLHSNALRVELLERLKGYESYQGARYEIGVAAIFARLGFNIDFIQPKRGGPKHAEFIASHQQTGMKIAVEAKSRHRLGVLHKAGTAKEWDLVKGDVTQLYNQALQKDEIGKMPSMIFIDVNCPITDSDDFYHKRWPQDIKKLLGAAPTASNPDPCNAIAFTNYSYHYQKDDVAKNSEHLLVIPFFTRFEIKDKSLFEGLQAALKNYGSIPMIEPEPKDDEV